MVGYADAQRAGEDRRGFPTDFPVVGYAYVAAAAAFRRGFPTDFPVVGSPTK